MTIMCPSKAYYPFLPKNIFLSFKQKQTKDIIIIKV